MYLPGNCARWRLLLLHLPIIIALPPTSLLFSFLSLHLLNITTLVDLDKKSNRSIFLLRWAVSTLCEQFLTVVQQRSI
uniref:Uncharacterized protein n=1 Tax=Pristionchus pacificus TaxID=54126 RepID=A0A2A6CUM1_PRIPA|eukprot:PDM81934.1 hypothetical protein PRIPAC_34088 [Pristionchus pacificus]